MREAWVLWMISSVTVAGLLAIPAWIVSRWTHYPQLAHALWLLVLAKLITPPLYPIEATFGGTPSEAQVPEEQPADFHSVSPSQPANLSEAPSRPSTEAVRTASPMDSNRSEWSWIQYLLAVWVIGTVLSLLRVGWQFVRFRRLLAHASPADEDWQGEAECLAQQYGLKTTPRVFVIDACLPPLVLSVFGRSRIVLPRKLCEEFSEIERRSVLAHEMAHLRRKDHWWRWIEILSTAVHWWNPLAWWASREFRQAEEACCDAWVIEMLPESREHYGRALLATMEFLSRHSVRVPNTVGGTLGYRLFKRRIEMIMEGPSRTRLSKVSWIVCGIIAAIALPVVADNASSPEITQRFSVRVAAPDEEPDPAVQLPNKVEEFKFGPGETSLAVIRPLSDLKLTAPQFGKVVRVLVSDGDYVKKGDVICEFASTEVKIRWETATSAMKSQSDKVEAAELSIRAASAQMKHSRAAYEMRKQLREQGTVSMTEFLKSEAEYRHSEAVVEKLMLERSTAAKAYSALERQADLANELMQELTVISPIDGVVLDVKPQVGEFVQVGDDVARVVSLKTLVAEGQIQNPDGMLGQTVRVMTGKNPKTGKPRIIPAKVMFVSPIVEAVNGLTRVRCHFRNVSPDGRLLARPGQGAKITFPKLAADRPNTAN